MQTIKNIIQSKHLSIVVAAFFVATGVVNLFFVITGRELLSPLLQAIWLLFFIIMTHLWQHETKSAQELLGDSILLNEKMLELNDGLIKRIKELQNK